MVSALLSGSSGPGSNPGQGHCVVFLGKINYLLTESEVFTGKSRTETLPY